MIITGTCDDVRSDLLLTLSNQSKAHRKHCMCCTRSRLLTDGNLRRSSVVQVGLLRQLLRYVQRTKDEDLVLFTR